VDEVLARTNGDARIHPELLTGTVLFGDLRGFTSFAEGRPIDEVIEVINTYLTLMTDAVLDHGGTLVSYIGDGVLAAFGAPLANEDHADLAIAAARAMAGEQLATFNAWLSSTGVEEPIRMGIGINSGPVLSGSVGSPRRVDYTVIGDTVNTASRIEAMTKVLDRAVLFSEQTRDGLRELPADAVALGEFEIRGRAASIKLWALDVEEPA
jgi:adenylate cyclase